MSLLLTCYVLEFHQRPVMLETLMGVCQLPGTVCDGSGGVSLGLRGSHGLPISGQYLGSITAGL